MFMYPIFKGASLRCAPAYAHPTSGSWWGPGTAVRSCFVAALYGTTPQRSNRALTRVPLGYSNIEIALSGRGAEANTAMRHLLRKH